MAIFVRRYRPTDRAALLLLEAGSAASTRSLFEAKPASPAVVAPRPQMLHVAECDGLIVGVIQVKRYRYRSGLVVPRLIAVPPVDTAATRFALLRPILLQALEEKVEKLLINAVVSEDEQMLLNSMGWHTLKRSRAGWFSCYPDLYTPVDLKRKALMDDATFEQFFGVRTATSDPPLQNAATDIAAV